MNQRVIALLTISPLSKKGEWFPKALWGRIFPNKWMKIQNWYRGIVKAKKILSSDPNAHILISSGFKLGEKYEMDFYREMLEKIGVAPEKIVTVNQGDNTISQINSILKYAVNGNFDTTLIWSDLTHFWYWWMVKYFLDIPQGMDLKSIHHEVVLFGLGRPVETVKNLFAPLILLYYKARYGKLAKEKFFSQIMSFVAKRREDGRI